jgi:hypothetical protein
VPATSPDIITLSFMKCLPKGLLWNGRQATAGAQNARDQSAFLPVKNDPKGVGIVPRSPKAL